MGAKTAKRLLMTSTKSDGSPDWDKVSQARLRKRNRTKPNRDLNLFPAQLLFGYAIRDLLTVRPGQDTHAETWINRCEQRELTLRHKVSLGGERWSGTLSLFQTYIPVTGTSVQ